MSLSSDRADILQTASGLRPVQLAARWHDWRRMGLSGSAAGEMVSSSFGHPMLVSEKDGKAGDALDRLINAAERKYREAIERARKDLDLALAIQTDWLVKVAIATKEQAAKASDFGVDCECCTRPIACTPVDPRRHGFCTACDKDWERKGRPDRVRFIKERRARLDMPEAVEA